MQKLEVIREKEEEVEVKKVWKEMGVKIKRILREMEEERGTGGMGKGGWWDEVCKAKKREMRRELREWKKRGEREKHIRE